MAYALSFIVYYCFRIVCSNDFFNEEALIMIKRLFYYVFLAYIIVGVIDTPSLIDRSLGRLPVLHDGRIKPFDTLAPLFITDTGSIEVARRGITNAMVISMMTKMLTLIRRSFLWNIPSYLIPLIQNINKAVLYNLF